jgi:hypothetical protein
MRWPWRRHGRRRRSDAPPQPKIDPWAASWGDTFLPQPPLRSAVIESPPQTSTVRLGFSDGTELELAEGDEHFNHLVEVAGRLNNNEAGRFAD